MEVKILVKAQPAPGNHPMTQVRVNSILSKLNNKLVVKSVDAATAVSAADLFSSVRALVNEEDRASVLFLRLKARNLEVDPAKTFAEQKIDATMLLECAVLVK